MCKRLLMACYLKQAFPPQLIFVFLGLISFHITNKFHFCARGWKTRAHVSVASYSTLARLCSPPSSLFMESLESFKLKWQAERMNLFSCNKWDPKSPRGRYSRNTWHGQFVSACMQREHTHTCTDTHIQMFWLTEPVDRLSKNYLSCLSSPSLSSHCCSFIS